MFYFIIFQVGAASAEISLPPSVLFVKVRVVEWVGQHKQGGVTRQLSLSAPLSIARATAVDEDALGRYFDLLERTMENNGLLE